MAIKKGAFAAYTATRELPVRGDTLSKRKKVNIFDSLDVVVSKQNGLSVKGNADNSTETLELNNGSKTVHASNVEGSNNGLRTVHASNVEGSNNGSQTVHSSNVEGSDNGSQTVHSSTVEGSDNGSQTVHDSNVEGSDSSSQTVHSSNTEGSDNGSQAVHCSNVEGSDNGSQTVHSDESVTFDMLGGNQRKIVIAFYKDISTRQSNETQAMTLDKISIIAGINKKSLKNTLFRMIKSGVLMRTGYKDGRGGWSKYGIKQSIIDEIYF